MNATESPVRWVNSARIAVVIPAYRTEKFIEHVVLTVPDFVSLIIVVDDQSPDNTSELVTALCREDPRIRLVRHSNNQGVGGAVLTGYDLACRLGAKVLVKMDGDGQMDPQQLVRLVSPILEGQADYAKGNRFIHDRELRAMPLVRRIGNFGLSFLTKIACGYWNIFDPTNGYTALHAAVFLQLDRSRISRRYFFENSLLIELGVVRAVVEDVVMPAIYGAEDSSLSVSRALIEFPLRLLRGAMRRIWTQHFVRDFGPCSLLGTCGLSLAGFGLLFGGWHWYGGLVAGSPTPTGTIMLSVLSLVIGVQFLLQSLVLDLHSVPTKPLHPELSAPPPLWLYQTDDVDIEEESAMRIAHGAPFGASQAA